ncbi:MAG: 30S ribosomal protein S6--L-glutamate ligase [Proteobacteria bacterium]|nr:30S ribosomal protein S6--L-glutamate ligase [Pseudomonadota bacterium]
MRIGILATNPKLYSHRRLMESARARGHEVRVINTLHCYMNITSENPEVHYRGGEVLSNLDAVIPRIGASITFYGTAVIRQFEAIGVYCLNSSISINRSRDKLRSLQMLAQRRVPMPTTGFAHSVRDTEDLINLVGGAPLIVKLLEGTQGVGVMLAETRQSAASLINAFKGIDANILVQEFIKEAKGTDIRCFVVGDKVVATMKRVAKEGEFRSNFHLGATVMPVDITDEERKMAIQACKAMGLNVAGVDIIRSKKGPLVLEINSSPGFEGIEKATGKDIAGKIIEFIEENHNKEKDTKKAS